MECWGSDLRRPRAEASILPAALSFQSGYSSVLKQLLKMVLSFYISYKIPVKETAALLSLGYTRGTYRKALARPEVRYTYSLISGNENGLYFFSVNFGIHVFQAISKT